MAMSEEEVAELKSQLQQQKLTAEIQRNAGEAMMNDLRTLRAQMDAWALDKEQQTREMTTKFESWAAGKEMETSQLRAEIVALQARANQQQP